MAYKFYTDNSKHMEEKQVYTAYMIVGSYFHRTTCKNPFLLTRTELYYREMGSQEQEKMEARMIEEMEKTVRPYKEILACMNCEVTIRRKAVYGKEGYELCFETGFEKIKVVISEKKAPQIWLER